MLRYALWLSQVFKNIDSKFWCYLVVLCINFKGSVAPFLCLWRNVDLLRHLTPRLGAAVHPLPALFFPILKQISICEFPKKLLTSTLQVNSSFNKHILQNYFSAFNQYIIVKEALAWQLKAKATRTNRLWGGRWRQCPNVQNRNLRDTPLYSPTLDRRKGGSKGKLARRRHDESK